MSAPTPVRHVEDAERRARLGVRHRLAIPAATTEDVAHALVGLHATDPASIGLAVWARTPDVIPGDVEHRVRLHLLEPVAPSPRAALEQAADRLTG